jgi:hypothetical protein
MELVNTLYFLKPGGLSEHICIQWYFRNTTVVVIVVRFSTRGQ